MNPLLTKHPNKLCLYTQAYDGHALRAFAYYKEQMPDIRQATEEDKCFKIKINDQYLHCKNGDFIIDANNIKITVEEYYEKYCSSKSIW